MTITKEASVRFYQNLGKLFYAIAAIDNRVREVELKALENYVKNEWNNSKLLNHDASINMEDCIKNTFIWLDTDKEYDAETCFESFISFKNNNEDIFTEDIKKLILKTASKIASSFSGQNKSELVLLGKLSIAFKNTDFKK